MRARAFAKQFWHEVSTDKISDVAAMMTYYAIFALFPMLVFVITIALLVLPEGVIQDAVAAAATALPGQVATLLSDQIQHTEDAAGAGFAIGGALLALWGASRGAASLMTALNDMFEKEETRPWWKRQVIAIVTTLVVAAILLVAMALIAAGPALGEAIQERLDLGVVFDVSWTILRWVVAVALVMLVWAIVYRYLPDTDAPFRIFTPGAAVGVLLWFGVTQLFGVYLDNFGDYEKTYGALATVIAFMTWLWISNLALLIGAEVNDALAELRKHKDPAAAKLAAEEKPSNVKSTKGPTPQPA
jgi:membrane protein